MLRFPAFGVPVTVHTSFWITSALLGGALTARSPADLYSVVLWMAVVFLSILWHELGHAYFIRKYGGIPEIALYSLGGLAYGSPRRLARRQEIIISVAGPAAQLMIGAVVWYICPLLAGGPFLKKAYLDGMPDWRYEVVAFLREYPMALQVLSSLWFVNVIWALVNLLPVFPLDGGRISMALFGPRRERAAIILSFVFAVGLTVLFFYMRQAFAGILFGMLAWNNWQRLNGNGEVPWTKAP